MENTDFQGWILNLINKTLSSNRQYFLKISDQSDKIIVWLVGFSVASIALTLNSSIKLDSVINNLTSLVFIFGSLTVIFGVLYRIFLFIAQTLELRMLVGFEGYIIGYNNPPKANFGRQLSETDTYYDIVSYLNEDFEIQLNRIDISKLDSNQIEVLRKNTAEYYLSLNNWANTKLEKEKEEVKNVLSTYLGYSKKKLEKIFNPKTPKVKMTSFYWFSYYAALTLFVLSCLTFTAGMITFLIEYLIKISG